jgi:hypothetical protein
VIDWLSKSEEFLAVSDAAPGVQSINPSSYHPPIKLVTPTYLLPHQLILHRQLSKSSSLKPPTQLKHRGSGIMSTRGTAEAPEGYPIIDSHIHLFPKSELDTLAWAKPSQNSLLYAQYSVDEYVTATNSAPSLEGFVFLETDRRNDLKTGAEDGTGWEMPLMEVDWLKRVALGTPREGEGHSAEQKELCLAIIPWAPVPSGAEVLERYVKEVEKHAEGSFSKIKGFRYLLQDKPNGTMLEDGFIEGLRWLGKKGYVFDLGVDQHRRGKRQLEETVEMIEKAHEGVPEAEKVSFIISEFDLRVSYTFPVPDNCQIISASRTSRSTTRLTPSSWHGAKQCSNSASAATRS